MGSRDRFMTRAARTINGQELGPFSPPQICGVGSTRGESSLARACSQGSLVTVCLYDYLVAHARVSCK